MSAVSITSEVADRFHGLRRTYLLSQWAIALLIAVGGWLAGWVMFAMVDYHFELPLKTRRMILALLTSVALLWLVVRSLAIFRRVQERSFAGHLENTFGDFGQRIRTVLDTVDGRVSGPDEMLSALGHQTMGRWETLVPEQILPRRSLLVSVTVTAALICICAALFLRSGDWQTAMRRAVGGTEVYTQLAVTPGDEQVLEGSMIDVSLTLFGRTDRQVSIRHRVVPIDLENDTENDTNDNAGDDVGDEDGGWIETSLTSEPMSAAADGQNQHPRQADFAVSLGKAKHALEYQFLTDVADSEIHRIDVRPLIKVVEVATEVTPPEYTQLNQRRFTARKVTVLEGSEVMVFVQTNHPLHAAVLELGPRSNSLEPVEISAGDDAQLWKFPLSSDETSHWKFSGQAVDGTPMTPITGRINIRRDTGPKITFKEPTDRLEVHTLAEVPMTVHVSDDFGLQECGLVFELGDEGQFVLTDWQSESDSESGGTTTRVKLSEVLPLESFHLTERDYIGYYAFAIDNKGNGPQRSESDIRYIDIRQLRQYFREREAMPDDGGGQGGGGPGASLGEIIRRERFLVNRTRRLTRSVEADLDSQLGTIERMVENQSDLAGLVRQLTTILVERGNDDVSALNQAEVFMLQASDSLAAASFDLALIQQNDCLQALAEGRRTLERVLSKTLTRQQRQQMARFNQQLRQKLRRERPKSDQQLADTLERIASDQQRLSIQAGSLQKISESLSTESQKGAAQNTADGAGKTMNGERVQLVSEGDQDDLAESEKSPSSGTDATTIEQTAPDGIVSDVAEAEADGDPPAADADGADDGEKVEDTASSVAEPDIKSGDVNLGSTLSVVESIQQLFDDQVELLERLQAVSDELQGRDDLSSLIQQRLESALQQLDDLASSSQGLADDQYIRGGIDAADSLRELSAHLKARQPGQAVERIGRIRDLTSELSGLEYATSTQSIRAEDPMVDRSQDAWNPLKISAKQIAARTAARTKTIEDVLQVPVEMGDVETSEVNDELRHVVMETEFDQRLQDALEVAEATAEAAESLVTREQGGEALKRAIEFAEIAERLDELYQELVAPRINRLRQLESQACKLQGGGGGKSQQKKPAENPSEQKQQGGKPDEKMSEQERKAAMRQMKSDLEAAGLKDLAKLLDSSQTSQGQLQQMMKMQPANAMKGSSITTTNSQNSDALRIDLLVKKLRDQIQQVILLEISADRNASVPAEYETLVDGYFRALAEGPLEQ